MSIGYNLVVLGGVVTRDPDVKHTQSGVSIAKGSLAINRKTKDGQETTYVNFTAFGKVASAVIEPYVTKGSKILIQGRLNINTYTNADGIKKESAEIIVENVQLLGEGKSNHSKSNYAPASVEEDEIPF
jgi:single-strand DNA-binding protein